MLVSFLTPESPTEPRGKGFGFFCLLSNRESKAGFLAENLCTACEGRALCKNESIRYFLLSTFPVLASTKAT
jgi:hypothetical protein